MGVGGTKGLVLEQVTLPWDLAEGGKGHQGNFGDRTPWHLTPQVAKD